MFRILWDPSSGSIKSSSLKLLVMFVCVVGVWQREIWTCGVCIWCDELRTTVGESSLTGYFPQHKTSQVISVKHV